VKRALGVAAAGAHNLLILRPPLLATSGRRIVDAPLAASSVAFRPFNSGALFQRNPSLVVRRLRFRLN
jgi:hypothetical protein